MATYCPHVVLITGATGDFGVAFAKRFADAGSKLVLHGRDPEKLAALAANLKTPVHTLAFDITDHGAMVRALEFLPAEFAEIDLLINNAGGAIGQDAFYTQPVDDYQTMIDVNVTGLVQMTRAVLPGMVTRGRGHIINIGSIAGNYPYPGGHVYCAAKAFVKQFSLSLRSDLNATGVRVTNIEPGMVETQFSLVRFKGDAARAQAVYAGANPLTASDVAESVFWAATLPEHVNINRIELMPTTQAPGPLQVHRVKSA